MGFQPTQQMITAAENLFVAMASRQTVEPVVRAYQKEVLSSLKPVSVHTHEVITDPALSYEMTDADFKVFLRECNQKRIEAKLHAPSDEHCPLLVAKELERDAEHILIEVMAPTLGLNPELLYSNLDAYAKFIDLTLRLLAPFVGSNTEIFKRMLKKCS